MRRVAGYPESLQFNAAVATMAGRLFPAGFDVAAEAPDTLARLNDHIARTGRMLVWRGESSHTIFGDADVNHGFRAWHDWAHWRYALDFTPAGEAATAYVQAAHLVRLYGDGEDVAEMVALLLAEVIGQGAHFERTGLFPQDQRSFTVGTAPLFAAEATALVAALAVDDGDRHAIRLANARLSTVSA